MCYLQTSELLLNSRWVAQWHYRLGKNRSPLSHPQAPCIPLVYRAISFLLLISHFSPPTFLWITHKPGALSCWHPLNDPSPYLNSWWLETRSSAMTNQTRGIFFLSRSHSLIHNRFASPRVGVQCVLSSWLSYPSLCLSLSCTSPFFYGQEKAFNKR